MPCRAAGTRRSSCGRWRAGAACVPSRGSRLVKDVVFFTKQNPYPSDLSDKEWELLNPLLPLPKARGRKRRVNLREIVNAIFYVLRTGCQWDYLPHDFPPSDTVYGYFRQWKNDGTWGQINDTLRGKVRQAAGKEAEPR